MNFVASCSAATWVGRHHRLINIQDPLCKFDEDVVCKLDLAVSDQPDCGSSVLGTNLHSGLEVVDIVYGTGKNIIA
jgi:hypothetical protein